MHHLPARVRAAVGSAGAGHSDRPTGDRAESRLEGVLHGASAGLRLPSKKAAAVVFESQGYAHKAKSRGRWRRGFFFSSAGRCTADANPAWPAAAAPGPSEIGRAHV